MSSDVYFYTIGGDLYLQPEAQPAGRDALQDTARQYGFGKATGVPLPNEATGRVPDAAWKQKIHDANPEAFPYPDWLPGDNILSSVGQGDILATPLQLANAYAVRERRHAVRAPGRVRGGGRERQEGARPRADQDRDGAGAGPGRDARGLHRRGRGREGHGVQRLPRLRAGSRGGKTGTAQVQGKQSTSWFVGMTPATNPQYFVLTVVEEGGYGSGTAAPTETTEGEVSPLNAELIDVPSVEISGEPNEAGLYEVPLSMIARQAIAGDQVRGTLYTGQVRLAIAGLPNDVKAVGFNFRSPSLYQRYLAPIVVPVYSMPAVLCTGPLTLLILLVVVARMRGRI